MNALLDKPGERPSAFSFVRHFSIFCDFGVRGYFR